MVLELWLEVTRPCSSLTSLWKEIPVDEALQRLGRHVDSVQRLQSDVFTAVTAMICCL